ncbi:MAG: AAA family ATPase [Saprospiraceae bacterium]|nr:AAA family ATPase [Saprospiraceae bacterium]
MPVKSIYVAATRQHVGKTTSTLGLVTAFKNKGIKVGYCKPVGQQSINFNDLQVDKDALLFSDVMDFELEADVHSPVILGKGATAAYIEHPESYNYRSRIEYASQIMEARNELVIYEGTGHPGVGSVVGLSNADVAKMLHAGVVMIVEGGIGSTIDMLSLCMAKFQLLEVPLLGVILNKVDSSKTEKVAHYVGKALKKMDIPLLGILPYDRSLAFPLMKTVCDAVNGVVVYNEERLANKVEDIISGSLLDTARLETSDDLLLVASSRMVDTAVLKIEEMSKLFNRTGSPLSGIVATGPGELQLKSLNYIRKHEIPLVRTSLDTFGVVLKYSHIEVKINRATPWKINRAIQLIEENVNLDQLLDQVELNSLSK